MPKVEFRKVEIDEHKHTYTHTCHTLWLRRYHHQQDACHHQEDGVQPPTPAWWNTRSWWASVIPGQGRQTGWVPAPCGSVSLAELASSGLLRDPVSKIEGEGEEDTQHWSLAFTCIKAHMCIYPTHRAQGVGVWICKKKKEKENANLYCYLLFIRSVTSTLLS